MTDTERIEAVKSLAMCLEAVEKSIHGEKSASESTGLIALIRVKMAKLIAEY